MKNYKELTEYYKDSQPNQILEDLYLDLLHRTETINKLSRKIQKLKKQLKKEQELKEFQYSMKSQAYERIWTAMDYIDQVIMYNPVAPKLKDEINKLFGILGGKDD